MSILKKDKLHIVGITDDFVKSLASLQILLKGYPIKMDIVSDNFPIPQDGILGIDYLKDSGPTDIRYDV